MKDLPKFETGRDEDKLFAASDRALNAALREFEPFLGIHTAAELGDFFLWQAGCHVYPELRFIEGDTSEEVTNPVAKSLRAKHVRRVKGKRRLNS